MIPEIVRQRKFEDYENYERFMRAQHRGEALDVMSVLALTATLGIAPPEASHDYSAEFALAQHSEIISPLGSTGLRELVSLEPNNNPLNHPDQVLLGNHRSEDYALVA